MMTCLSMGEQGPEPAPHGAPAPFEASALPVIGRMPGARRATGLAMGYAHDEAEACGEDRFSLVLLDAEGRPLQRLGSYHEDEVVAVWRGLSASAGLPRMLVREDGAVIAVSRQLGPLVLGRVSMRRRPVGLGRRRPRFLARRKTGRLPARPQVFRGESEIIARS